MYYKLHLLDVTWDKFAEGAVRQPMHYVELTNVSARPCRLSQQRPNHSNSYRIHFFFIFNATNKRTLHESIIVTLCWVGSAGDWWVREDPRMHRRSVADGQHECPMKWARHNGMQQTYAAAAFTHFPAHGQVQGKVFNWIRIVLTVKGRTVKT